MSEETLYLIDGTSLCYRSFFALALTTREGLPTGAVYGVYQTLTKIVSEYKPAYVGVCFDVSRKTFRQEKYKEYKIQRRPVPEDLVTQIPMVKELIKAMGLAIIEKEGYEADDVIASLAREASADGGRVVIVTADKDMSQLLVDEHVSIYNYNKDDFMSKEDFRQQFGFEPAYVSDYLGLMGDASDNIPGAKGIGKVTAAKLITEFGSVENILAHAQELAPRMREIIESNKENIVLSKELATLHTCALDVGWRKLKPGEPDTEHLYELFRKYEFKSLLKELPKKDPAAGVAVRDGLSDKDAQRLAQGEFVLSTDTQNAYVLDPAASVIHRVALEDAATFLADESVKKISYGFKEQLIALAPRTYGGMWFDVKIAAYLCDSARVDYALESLVADHLGEHVSDIAPEARPYFIERLYRILSKQLAKEGLERLFFDVEMPLVAVLAKMQLDGVRVQEPVLSLLLTKVDAAIDGVTATIYGLAGKEFNLNSPKQLADVLFTHLNIRPIKKTKTGFSTSEDVLEALAARYPVANSILEHRRLSKLKTTYIIPLIEEVKKNDGKLHTQFHQTTAGTGRLSSSEPNLQSIPTKGEWASSLRKAFVPTFEGGCIVASDYSQIELRILAHACGDTNLIDAFRQDLDIHEFTARLLFGIASGPVDEFKRTVAKRVNFGILYGMSPFGLSKELKISPEEASRFIDDYFSRYPRIKRYIDETIDSARKLGYVTTMLGRKRKLADLNNPNPHLREFAFRQAVNAPIQGTAADIIKVAMVNIYHDLKTRGLMSKLIMQIHDELVFDVPRHERDEVVGLVRHHMEKSIELCVPLKVNTAWGPNWADMQEIV